MADVHTFNLTKTYGNAVNALRACDLHVRDGERLAVLGPSGCGKTTLLRLIAGLELPTTGTVSIARRDVTHLPPRDRDVAMVFQDFALYPHMRVRRNLTFASMLRGEDGPEIRSRAANVARQLGIESLLDRKPAELSGGERQRVALGRVLVRRPACALFDEPLSHLDTPLRATLRRELRDALEAFDPTTIYVTHDQDEALTIGDRIAVMRDGRIHQVAAPDELIHAPADRHVAGFLGSPPMNLIGGTLHAENGRRIFRAGSGLLLTLNDATGESAVSEGKIVLGIRPDAIIFHAGEEDHAASAPPEGGCGRVVRVERLGDRAVMTLELAERLQLTAVSRAGAAPREEEHVWITLSHESIYLFDADDQGRLRAAPLRPGATQVGS